MFWKIKDIVHLGLYTLSILLFSSLTSLLIG